MTILTDSFVSLHALLFWLRIEVVVLTRSCDDDVTRKRKISLSSTWSCIARIEEWQSKHSALVVVVVVDGSLECWHHGCPTECAETSAPPFLDDPSGPPATDSLHQRCLFLLTRSQRTPETSVPECAHHHRILDTKYRVAAAGDDDSDDDDWK